MLDGWDTNIVFVRLRADDVRAILNHIMWKQPIGFRQNALMLNPETLGVAFGRGDVLAWSNCEETVESLTEFLSSRGTTFEWLQIFHPQCGAANAFLTMRSLLRHLGVDVSELTPSTPLSAIPCKDFYRFLLLIHGNLRGDMPSYTVDFENTLTGRISLTSGAILMFAAIFAFYTLFQFQGIVIFLLGILLMTMSSGIKHIVRRVEVKDAKSFRDFALMVGKVVPAYQSEMR